MAAEKTINSFPKGIITPPPSKSLSHRAVICAHLASTNVEQEICNIDLSDDIKATLSAVKALGSSWRMEGNTLYLKGGESEGTAEIDCVESGSTLRFMLPIAALSHKKTVFTGRGRLMERPLAAYEQVFAQSSVLFERIDGKISVQGPMKSGIFSLPGDVSSQFISGLLFMLPLLQGDSEIRLLSPLESRQYVDMTIDVMAKFGISIGQTDSSCFIIKGGQCYKPCDYTVEADYSQAAFFLAAAALGREVSCAGLNPDSLQGDRAILDILREMGAEIIISGSIVTVKAAKLSAVTIDAREIPDLVPVLSVLCSFCEGESHIINAGRLRFKESDRLSAMTSELKKLGADIEERPESLAIRGKTFLSGGNVDGWGDHRIAMSMAVAAIRCDNPVKLTGADTVRKSYPRFWDDFEKGA